MRGKMLVLILACLFLFAGAFGAAMSGTYYIGSSGTAPESADPHYATLKAACDAVMDAGVGGHITFLITSDLTEPANVDLAVNTGEFSITFKPYTGVQPTVTYTQTTDNGGTSGTFVIGQKNTSGAALVPTDNIIFDGSNASDGTSRDLSFVSKSGKNAYAFRIRGDCDNITIKNCNMTVTAGSYGIWVNSQDNAIPDDLRIENCSITTNAAALGTPIHISLSGTITEPMEGLWIINNELIGMNRCVFLNGNSNISFIQGNTFELEQLTSGYPSAAIFGHVIYETGETYIVGNDFKVNSTVNTHAGNGIRTILASGGGTFYIANNFFRGYSAPDAGANASEMIGIRCGSPVEAYFNTFVLNDIDATEKTLYRAINVAAGTPKIKNNIFVIEEDDFSAYAISGTPESDYNNFYLKGSTNAKAHPLYATLADLQGAGMDLNSVSKEVEFVSADDLHLAGVSVGDFDLAGIPIPGYETDIDGDVRSTEYPYMGADEASLALEPPASDPVIFADNFDHPDGTLLTEVGWTAHSGAGSNAITVNAPALSFEGYLGGNEGGAAELYGPSGEDINKTFTEQNAGSVYTAFLVNVTEASEKGDYFLHIGPKTMGSIYRGRIFVKRDANDNLAFGLSKSGADIVYSDFDYALNTTHLIVMKYTMVEGDKNDEVVLWVNPEGDTEPAALLTQTDTGTDAENVGTVALRQGAAKDAAKLRLDGLRLGTDWAAVVGDPVAPKLPDVDEPGFYVPKGEHEKGFATLKAAIDFFNSNGSEELALIILDADTLREEPLVFNAADGKEYEALIKPAKERDVVLIVKPGPTAGNGPQMISFKTGNVVIDGSNDGTDSRNLLITSETNAVGVPVGFDTQDANNVVLKNLVIKNIDHPDVDLDFRYGVVINDVGGVSGHVVENCQIGSSERPVRRDGLAPWGGGAVVNEFSYINNEIYAGIRGITTIYLTNSEIIGNTINLLPATAGHSAAANPPTSSDAYNHGIYITGSLGELVIDKNIINMPEKANMAGSYMVGIAFAGNGSGASDEIRITNNMINVGAADETCPCYGIGLRSGNPMGNMTIYHNTIQLNDNASTKPCYGIGSHTNGTGSVNIDLKNNIIINEHKGNDNSAAIGLIPASSVLESDNNVLVSEKKLVNFKGTLYDDLAAWQASEQDAASVSKAVSFVSATDLHLADPSNKDLDLVMPLIASVTTDIDGDARGHGDGLDLTYAGADEGAEFPTMNIVEDFSTNADIANWRSENEGWTVRTHVDGMMRLSDAGWTFDARRDVSATPNTFFKATAKIKTVGSFSSFPEAQYLYFGIDGLGDRSYQVSCISDSVFTTFTVIGYAVNEKGTLFIAGQGGAGADTVWVDEYTYTNNYVPEVNKISTVAEAREVPVGQKLATKGVVTTTDHFGSAGPVYIQDATAGYVVYSYDAAQNVELGDEILVIGTQKNYMGLLELDPTLDYFVLSKGHVVKPVEIAAADMDGEAYEGQLVMIRGVDTVSAGLTWPVQGRDQTVRFKDKAGTEFNAFLDKDTDISYNPKPTKWPLNLVAVVSDYNGPQLMPRSIADFILSNPPGEFHWLKPAADVVINSMDDPNIRDVQLGDESRKALYLEWSEAVDPDAGDTVTYRVHIYPNGPEEELVTLDTFLYIPLNTQTPYEMNGVYNAYISATDLGGDVTLSDTITITMDFPAPPEVVSSDIVLLDGVPKFYAQFSMPIVAAVENFKLIDWTNNSSVSDASAIDYVEGDYYALISGNLLEDHFYSLVYSGVVSATDTGEVPLTVTDTTQGYKVLIPCSAAHPEDVAKMICSFESSVGMFLPPTYSGSTTGILTTSTFAISDEAAYRGNKSGKLTLLNDPDKSGGWYLRLLHGVPFNYTVKTSSTIMFAVKGTNANVEMRLSVQDTGYEQGPWKRVTLCEDDWQIVSFDLANDPAEGWVNGNGIVEGETVKVEGIHMRCSEDVDVVLYIDEFIERPTLSPVDVTLNVIMKKWHADGKFNLATDWVDVAGTFNDWDGTMMADPDGDTTYSATVGMMPYSTQEFKFRVNSSTASDKIEFPNADPRTLNVPENGGEYTYWFNDDTLEVAAVGIPTEFALHQNYPNPFNPTTTINFDLPANADVKLIIYDITGRKIRTLVNGHIDAGYKKIVWNGRDDWGNGVATGMYIYRLIAGDFVDVKKMTFLK